MDVIEYEGKSYHRSSKSWVDSSGLTVCGILQDKLDAAFENSLDVSSMSVAELLDIGDRFKQNESVGKAIKYYEIASRKANERDLAYILPRLTSCYRIQKRPREAIDILTYANERYGKKMITTALLTSAAAAYCDIGDYIRAEKCCDRAYAESDGKFSEELSAVYERLKRETT